MSDAAQADPAVRAIVLAGEGADFGAGDVAAFRRRVGGGHLAEFFDELSPVLQGTIVLRLAEGPKPTIAAVAGVASGAGFDLALACDLRVVADDATFSTGYGSVGLVPVGGAPHHLVRLLGARARAALLLLPDRTVTAEEAVRWGLAVEVRPRRDGARPNALALAHRVAAGPATVPAAGEAPPAPRTRRAACRRRARGRDDVAARRASPTRMRRRASASAVERRAPVVPQRRNSARRGPVSK